MTLPEIVRGVCSDSGERKSDSRIQIRSTDTSTTAHPPSMSSVASSAPSSGNQKNVSEIVAKSKKAASSLFTLLHAKKCTLGVHRCTHPGCAESKLLFLHHKTCRAVHLEPCPTNHKGCADARKLLSHFRQCRDIRSRQVANRSREPQHVCLVCSLVARHAKGSNERSISPKMANPHRPMMASLGSGGQSVGDSMQRHVSRSSSPLRRNRPLAIPSLPYLDGSVSRSTPRKMPPPPPRFPFSGNAEYSMRAQQPVRPSSYSGPSYISFQSSARVSPMVDNVHGRHSTKENGPSRPRSESLGSRRYEESKWEGTHAAAVANQYFPEPYSVEEPLPTVEEQIFTMPRRRSASYSVGSSVPSGSAPFDPILEEPVCSDLKEILEGSDP